MTHNSDLKAAARALAAAEGIAYTAALNRLREQDAARHATTAAAAAGALRVGPLTLTPSARPTWDAPRVVWCHHCQTVQPLTAEVNRRTGPLDALPGLDQDGRAVYLAGYCPGCLTPAPSVTGDREAWRAHQHLELQRDRARREAVNAGRYPGAAPTDFYLCTFSQLDGACVGGPWSIDPGVEVPAYPLLDSSRDLYLHPCPWCWDVHPQEEIARVHEAVARAL